VPVQVALALLAMDREGGMILSLAGLIVAGSVVAIAAVVLVWRELGSRHEPVRTDAPAEPATPA
jgi:hypothetical protein